MLIVDDEDDIRELLELSLLRLGLSSDGAATLAEARRCSAEKRYRLCLTDMRRPTATGSSWCATSPKPAAICRWR